MARSRRNLAILPRIGAKFRSPTLTDPQHDVSGLGKLADFASSILETVALLQASISATSLREGRGLLRADLLPGGPLPGGLLPASLVTGGPLPGRLLSADLVTPCGGFLSRGLLLELWQRGGETGVDCEHDDWVDMELVLAFWSFFDDFQGSG